MNAARCLLKCLHVLHVVWFLFGESLPASERFLESLDPAGLVALNIVVLCVRAAALVPSLLALRAPRSRAVLLDIASATLAMLVTMASAVPHDDPSHLLWGVASSWGGVCIAFGMVLEHQWPIVFVDDE
jgi:hypothetical protein